MRTPPILALAALLAACAAPTPQGGALTVCSTYARTLTALAGYRAEGRLSPAQEATVEGHHPMFVAFCDPEEEPSADVLDELERRLFELTILEREARDAEPR